MEPGNSQKSNRYTAGLDNWDFEYWECEPQLRSSKCCADKEYLTIVLKIVLTCVSVPC